MASVSPEVADRLDEKFPGHPWQLNKDFAMHVLPNIRRLLQEPGFAECLLSIIERPAPEFGYPHKTLECLFCYGTRKVGEDLVDAARREGLEETGILLPRSLVQQGDWQKGLKSEHGNPLSMVVVRIPDSARAQIASFPEPVGNLEVDGMRIPQKWKGKRYISIVLDSTQTPQKRGQAGGCAAGADIQHREAAEGDTPADGGGAPSTATGVKGRTAAARQG